MSNNIEGRIDKLEKSVGDGKDTILVVVRDDDEPGFCWVGGIRMTDDEFKERYPETEFTRIFLIVCHDLDMPAKEPRWGE